MSEGRLLRMSVTALALEGRSPNRKNPALATGFIANASDGPMLVTNWHVVKGVDPTTNTFLDNEPSPTELAIRYLDPATEQPGAVVRIEQLYDERGRARWREHPHYGNRVDVVALPLSEVDGARWFPLDIFAEHSTWPLLTPGEIVSVVGYPFGVSVQGFAVWNSGFIASDLPIDYDRLPCFLIDSRTRPGQSGSPVVAQRAGTVAVEQGTAYFDGPSTWFLGVYSGRIHKESDIGRVWKAEAVRAVVEHGERSKELHPFNPPPLDDEEPA